MSRRRERFASAVRTVVAGLIQTELSDPRLRGLLTVTRVEVSPDLRLAKVYFSVLGNEGEQKSTLDALRHGAGHLQSLLKEHLEFRVCPILDFRIDEHLKDSLATMALIDKVSLELAEKDAQARKSASESDEAPENLTEAGEE
ncbi:MAG: 30S ribosome-binding factor RbfA [Actinobacteria bacterium]|nr:30S ribosome-binding factor RbfA [Actinomycetota bacterium]